MTMCQHSGGCERPVVAKGWCNAHYLRVQQHGSPGAASIQAASYAGEVCAFPDCLRPRAKRDWCGTHYERWRVHGDVTVSLVPRGNPGYLALHKQLYRRKGKAAAHPCAHCGVAAQQWAYDHLDPDERSGVMTVRGQDRQLRYSTDAGHYIALCISCHVQFDQAVAS